MPPQTAQSRHRRRAIVNPLVSDITTLLNAVRIDNDPTSSSSAAISTADYNEFQLYIDIDSTLAPTTLQLNVEFSDDGGTTWYKYMNDFFGDLSWEDTATASGLKQCVSGRCVGKTMRVTAVGVGTTASAFFDVTVKVEFSN